MKDEAGCRFAFEQAKKIGASVVQVSGTPVLLNNPALLKSLSDEYGIEVCVTHSPFERIANDIDALCQEHLLYGCHEIGIGAMPREYRDNKFARIGEFTDILNTSIKKAAEYGVTIAYHNHDFENDDVDGKTVFDHLRQDTAVNFIPDVFWLKVCGLDVCAYLKELEGRVNTVHYKDYKKFLFRPIYTTVGKGKLDFAAIDKTVREMGVKNAVIEIDIAKNPLKSVTQSMQYIERFKRPED